MARKGKAAMAAESSDNQTETPAANVEAGAEPESQGDVAGGGGSDAEARAQAARQALTAKMTAAGFGEIVSVLMRAPHYKHYSLADLEWLVVPPLLANQFTLAEARAKEGGIPAPVGIALWARVSEEVDAKLSSGLDRPVRLRPDEWTSGDIFWLIDAVGAPEAVKAMVARMSEAVFDGRPFKLRARDQDGKVTVQTVAPKADAAE